MPVGYEPSEVPLYESEAARDEGYRNAEAERRPFFAIERYEEGYAITYDLLPAGYELAEPTRSELNERLTRRIEAIVGDETYPTTEVSRSVGSSLGNLSFFVREGTAREVAAAVSRLVLDESNWVEASGPDDLPPTDIHTND